MSLKNIAAPGIGFSPKSEDCRVWNRSGARVKGDVVMLDFNDSDAGTDTDTTEGDSSSAYANAVLPATVGIGSLSGAANYHPGSIFGVVLDDTAADDTAMNIRVKGFVDVSVTATAATIGVGLFPANGVSTLTATVTAGVKCLALLRQANASTAGVYPCLFDGVNGFGHMFAS